jgi:hypothetical protein
MKYHFKNIFNWFYEYLSLLINKLVKLILVKLKTQHLINEK